MQNRASDHDPALELLREFQVKAAPRLEALAWVVRDYRATGSIEDRAWHELGQTSAFLRRDAEEHFRRVQEEVFPRILRALGEGGPHSVILYEHRVLHLTFRRFVKAVDRACRRRQGSRGCEEAAKLIRLAEEVRNELAAHLAKEEELVQRFAKDALAPAGS